MKKVTKIKRPAITTREEAEAALREFNKADLEITALKVELDSKVTSIRSEYEASIATATARRDEVYDQLRGYCDATPALFDQKKSVELTHGTLGYRTGNDALKQIARKTWEAILETIKHLELNRFVRVKEEVNREEIIAAYREGELDEATMRRIGVRVEKEERFYIEPKLESLERRKEAA